MDLFDLAVLRKAKGNHDSTSSGESTFELAVEAGYDGTEEEFYKELVTVLASGFQNETGLSVVDGSLCVTYESGITV